MATWTEGREPGVNAAFWATVAHGLYIEAWAIGPGRWDWFVARDANGAWLAEGNGWHALDEAKALGLAAAARLAPGWDANGSPVEEG